MKLYNGDCIEVLKTLPDASVDAVICDPPYGTIKNERLDAAKSNQWDVNLDYSLIIPELKRICKQGAALIIFYDYMKKYELIDNFKKLNTILDIELIWHKFDYCCPFTSRYRPAKDVEAILVFKTSKKKTYYYPPIENTTPKDSLLKYAIWCKSSKEIGDNPVIVDYADALCKVMQGVPEYLEHIRFTMTSPEDKRTFLARYHLGTSLSYMIQQIKNNGAYYIKDNKVFARGNTTCKKVSSILSFPTGRHEFHPTQKPLELMKKLVSLYSKEGDVVLDFCMRKWVYWCSLFRAQ